MNIPHNKSALAAVVGTLLAGSAFGGGWTLFDEQDSTTDVVMNSCNRQGICTTPLNFNGDINATTGQPVVDLAVANDGGPIRLYLGTGEDGRGFQASFELVNNFGLRSTGLRFADLDNDGDVEMVHTTRGGGNYVYRFRRAAAPFYCDSAPCVDQQLNDTRLGSETDESQGLAVGDIDLDCRIDVFVANGIGGGDQSNKFYLNQTAGIGVTPGPAAPACPAIGPSVAPIDFGPAVAVASTGAGAADSDSRKVELVDVDGDGDLDAIVANADGNDNWLYINRTKTGPATWTAAPVTPRFAAPVPLTAATTDDGEISYGLAVGNLDNDGDIDIVVANNNAANRYYLNSGTGTFTSGTFGSASDPSTGVKLGDMNRDGLLDAVVTNNPGPNRLHLLNGAAGGSTDYTIENPVGLPGATPFNVSASFALDLGKLNNDGWPDLVVGNNNGQYNVRFLSNGLCQNFPCNLFANQAPSITGAAGPPLTTPEDTPLTINATSVAITDGDNLVADLRMVVDPGTNYTVTSANPNVQTITPVANYNGPLTVNVRATDLTSVSAPAFGLTVTVTAVPDAPTFTSTPVTAASQGTPYSYSVTAADPDVGDTLTITATTKPAWLNIAGTGAAATLSGTPAAADIGSHPVTLEVRDAGGLVATQTFTVTVGDANDAPVFSSTAVTTATAGTAYSYAVTTSDPDTGDTRTIAATTVPAWLTLTGTGNGIATLAGTPAAANVGSHNVVLTVTDAAGASATQTFTVVVAAAPSGGGGTPAPAPAPSGGGGGGGGGSAGVFELLGLLAGLGAAVRRRRRG